jgi:hypothetical protein
VCHLSEEYPSFLVQVRNFIFFESISSFGGYEYLQLIILFCFFWIQAIEELFHFLDPNREPRIACNKFLNDSAKEIPFVSHAFLFVNTQLIAQFNRSKNLDLSTVDVLLLVIWFWSRFHHKG